MKVRRGGEAALRNSSGLQGADRGDVEPPAQKEMTGSPEQNGSINKGAECGIEKVALARNFQASRTVERLAGQEI